MEPFYAHTHPDAQGERSEWEVLFTAFGNNPATECQGRNGADCRNCRELAADHGHLNKVAYWAGEFASRMFPPGSEEANTARHWGWLAGLWHDLGKFAPEWQRYLKSKADPHTGEMSGKVDHSTAGAQHARENVECFGTPLAYLLAGHHAGLPNGIDATDSNLEKRLDKQVAAYADHVPKEILAAAQTLPPILFALKSGHSLGFFLRLLFSTLVDADFLATEAFMNAEKSARRPSQKPDIERMEAVLDAHLASLSENSSPTPVNRARAEILGHCRKAAEDPPGLYSLTVPTGGGKTLSSLAFALKHARHHNLRRVIYVIPFTSIIEQNAAVFREALAELGPEVAIEHHSNLDPESAHATVSSRLAAENWDARLIVTTNVQFFESLHANRTSRCRKLHRLARSVIVLDEAQSLPLELLAPCLRSLEELTSHYGSSVVLCTATQPAIHRRDDFPDGLDSPREIIPNPAELYEKLRRVRTARLDSMTNDETLVTRILQHQQALCIVNTRRHARQLYGLLPNDGSRFHLSALMCPEHRSEVLADIKCRLEAKSPVRLISTQLIEAGVDIDFPVVFRALAGLDSIAQAAGRCDREGRLTAETGEAAGQLFIFDPEGVSPPPFIRACANSASQTLGIDRFQSDILGLDAITDYFQRHFWDNRNSTDQKHILDTYPHPLREPGDLLCIQFKKCARKFQLIDDYTDPVLIPWGDKGKALCQQLGETFEPSEIRRLARQLQRYTVAIPKEQHFRLRDSGILKPLHDEKFFVLNSDVHYSEEFGLHPEPDLDLSPEQSIC